MRWELGTNGDSTLETLNGPRQGLPGVLHGAQDTWPALRASLQRRNSGQPRVLARFQALKNAEHAVSGVLSFRRNGQPRVLDALETLQNAPHRVLGLLRCLQTSPHAVPGVLEFLQNAQQASLAVLQELQNSVIRAIRSAK